MTPEDYAGIGRFVYGGGIFLVVVFVVVTICLAWLNALDLHKWLKRIERIDEFTSKIAQEGGILIDRVDTIERSVGEKMTYLEGLSQGQAARIEALERRQALLDGRQQDFVKDGITLMERVDRIGEAAERFQDRVVDLELKAKVGEAQIKAIQERVYPSAVKGPAA